MTINSVVKKAFYFLGYELTKKTARPIRKHIGQAYSQIQKKGFEPETIIDVGAAKGTPSLYNCFTDSYILLIEPLKEFEEDMKLILERRRGSYVNAAAGASSGTVRFYKHLNHLSGSSLYRETMGTEADGREITVPMIRLDDIVKEKSLLGPYLIKIDAQGAELNVLDGFRETLSKTEVAVLEVSMFEFMKGAPQFYDVVYYMKQRNFVAYDIFLGWNRPLDDALGQVDIVFVKENGMFRENHSYSTVDQLKERFG
ncbi:MAG: FkbM family methyltransferase [Desulfobacterium sp.]|nr:FkbM family methyltransferase [Desulfobacterium sp.]